VFEINNVVLLGKFNFHGGKVALVHAFHHKTYIPQFDNGNCVKLVLGKFVVFPHGCCAPKTHMRHK
jgi:hypothetical protein